MTDDVIVKLIYIGVAVIGYGLFRWRLIAATQDFRIKIGIRADRWGQDERVDPQVRNALPVLADMAFRPATPWLVLVGLINAMLTPVRKGHEAILAEIADDAEVAKEIIRLRLGLLLALITTSPLALVLALAVLVVGLLIRASLVMIEDSISMRGDRFLTGSAAS